jgi:hypothetical protein
MARAGGSSMSGLSPNGSRIGRIALACWLVDSRVGLKLGRRCSSATTVASLTASGRVPRQAKT